MATFSLGNVPSPIQQATRLAQLRELQNPNLALERQIQQAVELQRIQQQSPEGQLALQLKQAQLESALQQQAFQQQQQPLVLDQLRAQLKGLQNPNIALEKDFNEQLIKSSFDPRSGVRRAGVGAPPTGEIEPIFNPVTGAETPFVRDFEMRKSNLAKDAGPVKPIEVDGQLVLPDAQGKYQSVFGAPKAAKSPFTQQTVVSLTDPSDVRQAIPDVDGRPPAGYQFAKSMEQPMKNSEIISSQREIRNTYDEIPSKIDLFGKGQVPGSYQLKTRLDAVLNPVKGDYTKLNPQAKQTFVFALNKLRDPTSATLTTEARLIADQAGIGDRLNAFVEKFKTGDNLPDQVAKDIYQVISQVYDVHKESYLEDIGPILTNLKSINKDLTDIGVPVKFAKEVKSRLEAPQPTGIVSPVGSVGINPNAPSPVQPASGQMQEAIRWLMINPDDPRAPAVRQKLGL